MIALLWVGGQASDSGPRHEAVVGATNPSNGFAELEKYLQKHAEERGDKSDDSFLNKLSAKVLSCLALSCLVLSCLTLILSCLVLSCLV